MNPTRWPPPGSNICCSCWTARHTVSTNRARPAALPLRERGEIDDYVMRREVLRQRRTQHGALCNDEHQFIALFAVRLTRIGGKTALSADRRWRMVRTLC